eukprot:TRINITY_DN6044_c0_g1_i2.p1 TRINITY_DN6044_c0_g1~~TRINITY_DN6044_c0_g1_i2.p1  ORF type:complete len:546 (-),score=164.03 TRINITY_DN6044_c0_g1_i2:501-2138(-)
MDSGVSPPSSPFKRRRGSTVAEFESEDLLTNWESVYLLWLRSSELTEFAPLLYKFFEVHGRALDLLGWAIRLEIETTVVGELCRGETIACKLFHIHMFSDAGKRYIADLAKPFLPGFLDLPHHMEIEKSTPELEQNINWITDQARKFTESLMSSPEKCPIGLRESFVVLKKAIETKVMNARTTDPNLPDRIVGSFFFLRFVCPTLISPVKYGLLSRPEYHNSKHGPKALVYVCKLLQYMANGTEVDSHRPYAKVWNEFITTQGEILSKFVERLVDEEDIKRIKSEKDGDEAAQEEKVAGERYRRMAEENLQNYLLAFHQRKELESEMLSQNANNVINDSYYSILHGDKKWKLVLTSKKRGIKVFDKRPERGESGNVVLAATVSIPVDVSTLFTVFRYVPNIAKFEKQWSSCICLEQFDENKSDWYVEMEANFPFVSRDWLFSGQAEIQEDRSTLSLFTIKREDKPQLKKYVRGGHLVIGYIIAPDPSNDKISNLTIIQATDERGKQVFGISAKVLRSQTKAVFNHFNQFKMGRKPSRRVIGKSSV